MKLRQKLAMVLAAAMVVTAVPVTTMAASTNALNKTVSLVDGTKVTSDTGLFLTMDFSEDAEGEVFYLKGHDFKFNKKEYQLVADKTAREKQDAVNAAQAVVDAAGDKVTDEQKDALKKAKDELDATLKALGNTVTIDGLTIKVSENELQVTVVDNKDVQEIAVPIFGTAKKGTPAIEVDGSDSLATSGKYTIAGGEVVTDKALTATVDGDALNISIDGKGELGSIKIEEAVAGSLAGQTIKIELGRKTDIKFASNQNIEVEGLRGLADNKALKDYTIKFEDDKETLKITFPSDLKASTRGAVVIKGLDVVPQDAREGASVGKVEVTVSGDKVAKTNLHVANVSEFGHELKVKEEVELTAGKDSKKVEIQFNELAAGSINANRDVFFTIKGANVKDFAAKEFKNDAGKVVARLTFDKKENEFQLSFTDKFDSKVVNKFAFEVELYADVDYTGDITVTATSRDFEDKEAKVGTVVATTKATTKEAVVKVGLNSQVAGEISLTEEEAGTFARNKEVIIKLDQDAEADGIKLRDAKVEVTEGDVVIDEDSIEVKNGEIRFKIKRESDEASTIKISEIELDVNRLTPEGSYGVVIGGAAISDRNESTDKEDTKKVDERLVDTIEVEKFVVVGTKNTEDLPDAAKAKEIILTVGSTAYTVNGEAKTADAAPFINSNNRTMVPVKFVAEEFGKIQFGTVNGVGTVTIFKDGSVLQFQNGSNIMNKNGINIPMDTKVVIQDGRTYVPFKYVADGLGIGYTYDEATKSITFTNQAK